MAAHKPTFAAFWLLALAATAANAADLTGRATIVDGDELEIAGQRVALSGISAPRHDENCGGLSCGREAAFALAALVERHWVECTTASPEAPAIEAFCRIGGPKGLELNASMVSAGWARAKGPRYLPQEELARRRRVGLWAN